MNHRVRKAGHLTAVLGMFLAAGARADFYTCKDSTGHVITSDRPIPECTDKAVQVFKDNGTLKNQLPSAEQRRQAELLEQQKATEAQKQESLKREQRYLTAHYPNEGAIEIARKKSIDAIDVKIAAEKKSIELNTAEVQKSGNQLSAIPKNQPAKIHELQLKIDDYNQSIQESTRLIQSYQNEEIKVNKQFDETHKRYREIIPAN